MQSRPDGRYGLSFLELDTGGEPRPLFSEVAGDVDLSPGDRWIAYEDGGVLALVKEEPESRPEVRVVVAWDREVVEAVSVADGGRR